MKKLITFIITSLLACSLTGDEPKVVAMPPAAQPGPPGPDSVARAYETAQLKKERDDAVAALAAAQIAAQQKLDQQNLVAEYWKAMAEKNQAVLQIVGLSQQLDAEKKKTTELEARVAELEAAAKANPSDKK